LAKRGNLDKRKLVLGDIPLDERIGQWTWIQDKRVIKRFVTLKERETLVQRLVCQKCGTKCKGHCDES